MRNLLALVAVAALSVSLVACSDSGSGGGAPADPNSAVGTWAADMAPMLAAVKPMLEAQIKAAESMAGANPEAKKQLDELRSQLAEFDKAEIAMTLKSDGSATMRAVVPGQKTDNLTGSWTQTGDQVTITPKTKNGAAVTGEAAEAKTLTLKNGVLSGTDEGMPLTFKRK
jgi:hypothetical protein